MDNKILVTRSSIPPFDEYKNEIRDIWESHWLTNMGSKHRELQNSLLQFLGVDHIELFTNGHMALELSLQALGLGGEVITTPFTFASTTHAIVRNGLKPVFCDIRMNDYTIDTSKIEELITDKTSAIVPVHVYGNICNVEEIDRISKKYGLKVLYDAAHAFGEKYRGKGVGSFGDVSCFSFHATKVFNTIEGGAACYHTDNYGKILYQLKNFGIEGPESVTGVGANAKMNEFCAAMGICNLRHFEDEIKKRKKVDDTYRKALSNVRGIELNPVNEDIEYNYAYFPVVVDEKEFGVTRDDIYEKLLKRDIVSRKYFFPLTSDFRCYREKYNSMDTPIAKYISDRVLTLPLYADLELETVEMICDTVLSARENN